MRSTLLPSGLGASVRSQRQEPDVRTAFKRASAPLVTRGAPSSRPLSTVTPVAMAVAGA